VDDANGVAPQCATIGCVAKRPDPAEQPWCRLREIAAMQDDVVSRRQLAAVGVSAWRVRDQLRARRWRLVGRHAVVLHRGPLTPVQRSWAYVLHAGQPALVGGRSALTCAGLTGWAVESVCILVPKSRRMPRLPGIWVHETRRWPGERLPGLPRTTVARSAVDAAVRMRSARWAAGLLAAVVQQRLATADELAQELRAAGRVRHRRVLGAALADIVGGSQALSEIDFIGLCRRAGLPEPLRQSKRRDRDGRIRYLDAEWILPDGRRVVAEVDGALHLRVDRWWADMARDNAQALDGALVLRFPSIAQRTDEASVVSQLRVALAPLL